MYNEFSFTNSKVGMWKEFALKKSQCFLCVLTKSKGGDKPNSCKSPDIKWKKEIGEAGAEIYTKNVNYECESNGQVKKGGTKSQAYKK